MSSVLSRSIQCGIALLTLACGAAIAAETAMGPSTNTDPYVVPSNPALSGLVKTKSILTVGDQVNGYRLVGIPDGLGALREERGNFALLVNHEFGQDKGARRAHGATGAFISRWTIRAHDLKVLAGSDLTGSPQQVYTWDRSRAAYINGPDAWNRFCSADLPKRGAFFHAGAGTLDRIYLTGEEYDERFPVDAANPDHGRAYAHLVTGEGAGQAWQLARLGRMAFENVLASPHRQNKTVVIGMDDADRRTDPAATPSPSELYIYVGHKMRNGSPIERAGLTNGDLFGVRVKRQGRFVTEESNTYGLGDAASGFIAAARFSLHDFGDVSAKSGVQLQDEAIAAGVTRLQRIEDGAWDPRPGRGRDFYFVTTGDFRGAGDSRNLASRLWRLRFDDIEHPEAGGTIEILLQGHEGHQMLDNLAIDHRGRILMQEDVGGNDRLGKIWLYDIETARLIEVAAHNPKFFSPGVPDFLTRDEESSGIIDAAHLLGDGWFLLTAQAHYDVGDAELVEGGQLLALYVDPRVGGSRYERWREDE